MTGREKQELMELKQLLLQRQAAILKRWFDLILGTYPPDTAAPMQKGKDPFTNPVGSTISQGIETVFRGLLENGDSEGLSASLNSILKIRSVQDFSPSKAVGFIFLLKKAIEETLKSEIHKEPIQEEWLKFNSKIDGIALHAFDLYMDCREKICEIRVNKARAERETAFKMMERMTYRKEK
jgi:hypothetical protein